MYILFLTDGQDGNRNQTCEVSQKLKEKLREKNICAWFNIIGLGDGIDGKFLGDLSTIGIQRGQFQIASS